MTPENRAKFEANFFYLPLKLIYYQRKAQIICLSLKALTALPNSLSKAIPSVDELCLKLDEKILI
ncbi:MAG: hypothetical protein QNJ54_19910 [Prochloraceae cyanobacterium]|nr:hypothetical protein [Prochloraceae cyanobacterium]